MELLGENGKRLRALTVSPKWIVRRYRSSGKQVWLVDTRMNHTRLVRLQTSITRSTVFPAGASCHLSLSWQTPVTKYQTLQPHTYVTWNKNTVQHDILSFWNRNTNVTNNTPTGTCAKFQPLAFYHDLIAGLRRQQRLFIIWITKLMGQNTTKLFVSCYPFNLTARTALWGFRHRRTGSRSLWLPDPILAVIARRYAYHGLYS